MAKKNNIEKKSKLGLAKEPQQKKPLKGNKHQRKIWRIQLKLDSVHTQHTIQYNLN